MALPDLSVPASHLVKHEGNHERAHNARVAVDAQVEADKDRVENDARLEHDGGYTVLGELRLEELLLGLLAGHKFGVSNFDVSRAVAVAMTDERVRRKAQAPAREKHWSAPNLNCHYSTCCTTRSQGRSCRQVILCACPTLAPHLTRLSDHS